MTPQWEKDLRRKLRPRLPWSWWTERLKVIFGRSFTLLIVGGWPFGWSFMEAGARIAGKGGVITALGCTGGMIGFWVGLLLSRVITVSEWHFYWFPGDVRSLRRLQSIGWAYVLLPSLLIPLIGTMVAVHLGRWISPLEAAGWFLLAAACGCLLMGSKSCRLLTVAAFLLTVAAAWIREWLSTDPETSFGNQLIPVARYAWPPGWVAEAIVSRNLACAAAACVSLGLAIGGWHKLWNQERAVIIPADDTEPESVESAPEDINDGQAMLPPSHEERLREARQSVAFGWVGLDGYLPQVRPQWPDRWLWRWMTPRERLLSCPGGGFASNWFRAARWSAPLAMMTLAAFWGVEKIWTSTTDDVAWELPGSIAVIAAVFWMTWPGRMSVFRPWCSYWAAGSFNQVPAFAHFPVTARELLRALAKQWIIRAVPVVMLWAVSAALAIAVLIGKEEAIHRLPQLLAASAWLFSVMLPAQLQDTLRSSVVRQNRSGLLRLISGLFLAASAVSGLVTTAILAVAPWNWVIVMIAASSTLVACCGLRFTLWRLEGRRLDLRQPNQ